MARYLDIEQMVKRELRGAERVYVNGILLNGIESGNNKPFWKYVKSQKQETFGISALKSNGNAITDSLSKAEILNSQFKSIFTPQSGNTFPQLTGTQCPKIKPLHISENGVFMLLDRIDVSKSSGPDKLPGIYNILKKGKQGVVVDGKQSNLIYVGSGVPHGTVLGPLLFLLHINDLPSVVSSKVRLFADLFNLQKY